MLAEAGEAGFARDLLEQTLASAPEQATRARLLALRAWLRSLDGDEAGAADGVAEALADAGTSAGHLLRRERVRLAPLLELAVARGAVPPPSRWRCAARPRPRCRLRARCSSLCAGVSAAGRRQERRS